MKGLRFKTPGPFSEEWTEAQKRVRRRVVASMQTWYVYMIYSVTTGRVYTGITTDPARRLEQHNAGKGAKATRPGRPWKFIRVETFSAKGIALSREAEIKTMKRSAKLVLAGIAA